MQARCWPRSLDRGRLWPRRVDWSIHSQRLELCTYHLTGFCCQQLKYWSIPDRMKSFFGNRHGHVPLFQQSVLEAVSKRSGCRKAQSKWGQCMEDVSIEWRGFGVQSKFSDDLQLTSGEVAWRSLDSSSPKQRKIWWSHPECSPRDLREQRKRERESTHKRQCHGCHKRRGHQSPNGYGAHKPLEEDTLKGW